MFAFRLTRNRWHDQRRATAPQKESQPPQVLVLDVVVSFVTRQLPLATLLFADTSNLVPISTCCILLRSSSTRFAHYCSTRVREGFPHWLCRNYTYSGLIKAFCLTHYSRTEERGTPPSFIINLGHFEQSTVAGIKTILVSCSAPDKKRQSELDCMTILLSYHLKGLGACMMSIRDTNAVVCRTISATTCRIIVILDADTSWTKGARAWALPPCFSFNSERKHCRKETVFVCTDQNITTCWSSSSQAQGAREGRALSIL